MIPRESLISSWRYQFETKFADLNSNVFNKQDVRNIEEKQDDRNWKRPSLSLDRKKLSKLALKYGTFDNYYSLKSKAIGQSTHRRSESQSKNEAQHRQIAINTSAPSAHLATENICRRFANFDHVEKKIDQLLAQLNNPAFVKCISDRQNAKIWPEIEAQLADIILRYDNVESSHPETMEVVPSIEEATLERRSRAEMRVVARKIGLMPEVDEKKLKKQRLYELYKRLNTVVDQNRFECSPQTLYLKRCLEKMLAPEPLRLINESSTSPNFSLANFGVGDRYAPAISSALCAMKKLKEINLQNNRLSGKGIKTLLSESAGTMYKLRCIDLSRNTITSEGMDAIVTALNNSKSIRILKLSSVGAKQNDITNLCVSLKKSSCPLRILHLADNGLSHDAAASIGEMLKRNMTLTSLNLSWNNISNAGAEAFLSGLKKNIGLQTLDLRWNLLGTAAQALSESLAKNKALTHLDLSYNHLGPEHCRTLSGGLNANHTLLGLHMQGNAYTVSPTGYLVPRKHWWESTISAHLQLSKDQSSICLSSFASLAEESLQKLQNQSKATSRKQLESALCKNPTETPADLNRNSTLSKVMKRKFTSFKSAVVAVAALRKKGERESKEEGEIESIGNQAATKSAEVASTSPKRSPQTEHVEESRKTQGNINAQGEMETQEESDCCWICGRWREIRIDFVDYASAEEAVVRRVEQDLERKRQREQTKKNLLNNPMKEKRKKPQSKPKSPPPLKVALYLSTDGFTRPHQMEYIKGDFRYEVYVMLPPGPCEFFFTVDNTTITLSPNQHTVLSSGKAKEHFKTFVIKKKLLGGWTRHRPTLWKGREAKTDDSKPFSANPKQSESKVERRNELRVHAISVVQREDSRLPRDMRARPRTTPFSSSGRGKSSQWDKSQGVFKDYPVETTDFVIRSFQADCRYGKFHKFIPNDEERYEVLVVLQENYILLRVAYTLFCANSTGPSVSAVSWNAFTELCQTCDIPDKNCTIADLDNIFVATNVNGSEESKGTTSTGKQLNPDRDLCRFEFVEIAARIAIQKYVTPQIVDSKSEALRKLIDEHFIPNLDIENPQIFRERDLWTEPADVLFQKYIAVLKAIFKANADENLNRIKKRMSVTAWKAVLGASGVFADGVCTERDAKLAYRLSVINTLDEMGSDDHLSISLIEFLEAVGRIAFLSELSALSRSVRNFERENHFKQAKSEKEIQQREKVTGPANVNAFFSSEYQDEHELNSENRESFYSTDDPSSVTYNSDDEDSDEISDSKAGFLKRLALLLRLLIWHPSVYDREGSKSLIPREKSHVQLLNMRPSKAVPLHL